MVRDSSPDFPSLSISAQSDEVLILPDILGGLLYCRRVDLFLPYCLAGFFSTLLVPKGSLFYRGSKILRGTAPRLKDIFWEVFYMPFCIVVQQQRNSIGISSLLSDGLTLVAVFPLHYVEEERIK